jgi:paraquat-inducible protein A
MAIPLLKLLCQLLVLLSIRFDVGRSYGLLIYRIYHHLREWGMLEVYFMGVLVAIVKLVDLAELSIGLGLFCFISLLLVQVWLEVVMSPHQIWVPCPGRMSMRAIDAGILVCGECHELNRREADTASQTCTRCGAIVHERRPNSIVRTWALLITAMVLYIPANVLPIMTVSALGQGSPDTIMSGVITLLKHGMLPIAAVVFIASILVPTFKLVGIALLLYSVQRHQPLSARQRILMYRFIEFIGRWSMLDIFVIAILVAVVNLAALPVSKPTWALSPSPVW